MLQALQIQLGTRTVRIQKFLPGGYDRDQPQWVGATDTAYGTTVLNAPIYKKLIWTLKFLLPMSQALTLETIANISKDKATQSPYTGTEVLIYDTVKPVQEPVRIRGLVPGTSTSSSEFGDVEYFARFHGVITQFKSNPRDANGGTHWYDCNCQIRETTTVPA